MKASQAFSAIYDHAERLGLDEFGICAVAKAQSHYPEYEVLNDALMANLISPAEYARYCIIILNDLSKTQLEARVTALLLEVENAN